MNGYFPEGGDGNMKKDIINRMEPNGPNRNLKKIRPSNMDMFPDQKDIALAMQILREDYHFTSDMCYRLQQKIIERRNSDD